MDPREQIAERLIECEGKQPDADDQRNRQHGRRNPLIPSRPRDALHLGDDSTDEVSTGHRLCSLLLLLVHLKVISRENLAGRTGLEPATGDFGDRCATNCATALRLVLDPALLRLAMRAVAAAEAAIFAQLEPVRRLRFVFLRVVVAAFALGASHHHHDACFFLSHNP